MKTIYKLLLIIIILININVKASSNWHLFKNEIHNQQSPYLIEEITEVKNNSITFKIIIPEYIETDSLIISPDIFNSIDNYKLFNINNNINVNIIIENKSSNTYTYKNNSLYISDSFEKFNYLNTKLYRVKNKALKDLFNNNRIDLDDNVLNKNLKKHNYNELDEYYLDYYNKKYNSSYTNLNNFSKSIIKEIFSGEISNIKETNQRIIDLSFNYYFNELLKIKLNNNEYSIGEASEYYLDDSDFLNSFSNIKTNFKTKPVTFNLLLDKDYTNLFKDYFSTHLEFTLEKVNEKNQLITPPNTGI